MTDSFVYELIGYLASALVAISLMMSSIWKLRLINLAGAAAFAVYGALIGAVPVAAVNLFIVGINLFYVRQMLRTREYFDLLAVRPESDYLRYFLDHYASEIRRFLPAFTPTRAPGQLTLFVLRDLVPAGLFLGEVGESGTLHVKLDFVIPQYRDFKIGRYLFRERADFFRDRGIREIVSDAGPREHAAYLRRMGFAPLPGGARYRLAIG